MNICHHGMVDEYYIHLENLSFSSLSKLMEPAEQTDEPVTRTSRMSLASRFSRSSSTKRPLA